MRQASRVWAIGRRAHSTKLQAAVTKRPSSAGKFFAPCMISDPSTRKAALDGKISAPCIQNRPIAPGNRHMGRGSCHFIPKSMHEAKMLPGRGLIARIRGKGDAYGAILAIWALGPPQCKEGMRGFMGRRGGWRRWRARRVAALGQAAQRVAASAERARRNRRDGSG